MDERKEKEIVNINKLVLFDNRFLIYRVLIKYCVFSEDFKIFLNLAFLCFPSVPVCVHTPGR